MGQTHLLLTDIYALNPTEAASTQPLEAAQKNTDAQLYWWYLAMIARAQAKQELQTIQQRTGLNPKAKDFRPEIRTNEYVVRCQASYYAFIPLISAPALRIQDLEIMEEVSWKAMEAKK